MIQTFASFIFLSLLSVLGANAFVQTKELQRKVSDLVEETQKAKTVDQVLAASSAELDDPLLQTDSSNGILYLKAGTGISITDENTITNTDLGSTQPIFKSVKVSGQDTVLALTNTDALTFEAGSGITLTTNATDKTVKITSSTGSGDEWDASGTTTSLSSSTNNVLLGSGSALGKLTLINSTDQKGLVIKAVSGQTAKLLDILNSSGNSVASFDANGALTLPASGLVVGTNQLVVSSGKIGINTSTPTVALDVNGSVKVATNSSITLSSYNPEGTVSRLLQLRATNKYDRPWISNLDYTGRHVVAYGILDTNHDDTVHKRWEFKTVASSTGSTPQELLTRLAIDYDRDLADVIFGRVDSLGIHNNYGERISMVHQMRDSGNTGSYQIGEWSTELGANDSTVMGLDPKTLTNTKDVTFRMFRETNTSGQRRFVLMKGDGTATETFVINAATGAIRGYADAESAHLGSGSNTSSYVNFQSNRTMTGYDGSYAVLQGGTSKGVKFNVNSSSFGAGTAMTILSTGEVGIGTTAPASLLSVGSGSAFQVNSTGAIATASGITSAGAITFSGLNTAGGVVYTNSSGVLATVAGNTGQCLVSNGTSAPSWGSCGTGSGASLITENSSTGVSYLGNTTSDFLVGGTSTTSAKFAAINSSGPEFRVSRSNGNYLRLQKKSTTGSSIADLALTGEALLDLDPITTDGTSKSSVRLFRNVTTTDAGTGFTIYLADGTSTIQSFFSAKGNSYFNASAGNFGIGSSSVNYKLDVNGNAATNYVSSFTNAGDNANRYGIRIQAGANDGSGTTYYVNALDGNGDQVGYIANSSGTFGVTDISDARTKTNIADSSINGLDIIQGLRVVDFNRLSNPQGTKITGFIAQEVAAVFPNMVTLGSDGYFGINKDSLIPVLTKAVQQQQLQINTLRDNYNEVLRQSYQSGAAIKAEQLRVEKEATFLGRLNVLGETFFEGNVYFARLVRFGRAPEFTKDTAGRARILAGAKSVSVVFEQPYSIAPQVNATRVINDLSEQGLNQKVQYAVTQVTPQGFTLVIDVAAEQDMEFSWIALAVSDVTVTQSQPSVPVTVQPENLPSETSHLTLDEATSSSANLLSPSPAATTSTSGN